MFRRRNDNIAQKALGFLWPKKGFQRPFLYLKERLMRMPASTHALSMGLACGAAASMTPFLGFHFLLAAMMAYILRGNLVASAIGTIIGNPWTFPFIWSLNIFMGNWFITYFGLSSALGTLDEGEGTAAFLYGLTIGGVISFLLTLPVFYGLFYWVVHSWRAHRAKKSRVAIAKKPKIEPVLHGERPQNKETQQDIAS